VKLPSRKKNRAYDDKASVQGRKFVPEVY